MFQYAATTVIDKTTTTAWTTEQAEEYFSMTDSLGNRSRIAQVCITNALGAKERRYYVMQQVRIISRYGVVIFLGRIMNIEPVFAEQKIILTCRDYLGDLSEKIVTAKNGDGSYAAASRSWLIKEILDGELDSSAAGGDIDKPLVPRLLQDPSNYLEKITKTYSQRGAYGSVTDGVPGNYQYRGVKTVLEAISEIASEDAQQDLMVLSYANTKALSNITSTNHTSDPKTYPSTYWVDNTAGLQDGTEWFPTTRHVRNVTTPDAIDSGSGTGQDILYIGSNSKFDGIEYTFRQTGSTIHQSNYTTLAWQYWNGEDWKTFIPDKDSLFKQDTSVTDRVVGGTIWPSLIHDKTNTHDDVGQRSYASSGQGMSDWEKRDLSENEDMPHFNDWNDDDNSGWQNWRTPWHKDTYFNTFRIENSTNYLYLFKDSFTADADLKTNTNAWMTATPAQHTIRDGDQVTISGLTSGSGFNGTFLARHTSSTTVAGNEHVKLELYDAGAFTGSNQFGSDAWTSGDKTTNATGADITQATVDADASSEARITITSTTRQVDMKSDAIAAVNIGGLANTYRYWVRAWVKAAASSPGIPAHISTMELHTKPRLFRDFRAEDPKFFDAVWEYDSYPYNFNLSSSSYSHYPGGTWTSKNTTAGNADDGEPLLWDVARHETTFLDDQRKAWFFGSDEPFNGIELHAVQGRSFPITAISVANPGVVTVGGFPDLSNNDYILITGSTSGVTIDGYRQVTRVQQTLIDEVGHISATVTEFDVDSSHGLTSADTVLIDNEYMRIINVVSNTLTVERGFSDSTPVSHNNNTPVFNAAKFTVGVNTSGGAAGTSGVIRTEVPDYSDQTIYVDILDTYSETLSSNLPNPYTSWRTLAYNDEDSTWNISATPGDVAGITNHGPLAPLGPARWRLDAGRSTEELNHWYTELRFNTSYPRDSLIQVDTVADPDVIYPPWEVKRHIAQPEFDAAYSMSDSPTWTDRVSLMSGFSYQTLGGVTFTIDSIDYNLDKCDVTWPATGSYADSNGFSTGVLGYNDTGAAAVRGQFTASGDDRLLVVGITTEDDAVADTAVVPTAVRYGGSTGPLLTKADDQSVGNVSVSIWYLVAPVKEADVDDFADDDGRFHITVAYVDHIDVHVQTLFGVDQLNPVGTAVKATATSTAPSVAATTKANQVVFDCVGVADNASLAEGASQTEIGLAGGITGNADHRSGSSYEVASGTTTTMSWTVGSSQPWAIVALPINTSKPIVRLEVAAYSGGEARYPVQEGDWIGFWQTPGTDNAGGWDGVYKVTDRNIRNLADTFDFDMRAFGVNFTGAATAQVNIQGVATPPNVKSLHWARIRIDGAPNKAAALRSARMSNVARFKYFDRGKEPWITSKTLTAGGSSAFQDLDAVYYYDADRLANLNATASYATGRCEVYQILATDGYATLCTKAASGSSELPHYLVPGDWVEILGSVTSPELNGIWKVMRTPTANRIIINALFSGSTQTYSGAVDAPYVYPTSFADYTAESKSDSCKRELFITNIAAGTNCSITTSSEHKLRPGDAVEIGRAESTNSNPTIGTTGSPSNYVVRNVTDETTFIIETTAGASVTISTLGNQGSILTAKGISSISAAGAAVVTTRNAHGFYAGQRILLNSVTGGTPSVSGLSTLVKEVLTNTTFTIAVTTSGASTANTGYITADSAVLLQCFDAGNSPNGIENYIERYDAVYFGSKSQFTQLRFNFEERLAGFGIRNGYINDRRWEHFRSDIYGRSDGWATSVYFDPSLGLLGQGKLDDVEVTLGQAGYGTWKSTNPGVIGDIQNPDLHVSPVSPQTISLDQRIGKHLYYQRMKIHTFTAASGGATPTNAKVAASRVWCGPNLWDRDREVGTLSGVDSDRHTTGLGIYGLSLDDRQKSLTEGSSIQVLEYSLKDKAFDFVNRVTVRGRAGAYSTLDDTDSIDFYRVVKEKVVEDSSLVTDTQCFQRASALLEQLKSHSPMSVMAIAAADPAKVTIGGDVKYHLWSSDSAIITTVNEALDATEPDITIISSANSAYLKVGQVIVIDAEQMLITTVNSSTLLTVTRGVNDSTAVAHDTGSDLYLAARFRIFERKGLKIVANSRGVRETAADGTGTPVTDATAVISTNNFTYVTTEEDHGLTSGDVVLFTNISLGTQGMGYLGNTRWNFGGVEDDPSNAQQTATVYVVSPRKFKWTTNGTNIYGQSNDAVGGFVNKLAKTGLRVGDEVRIVGHDNSSINVNHNGLRTVVRSTEDGGAIEIAVITTALDGAIASTGATSVPVDDASGLAVGQEIVVGGEHMTITVISANTLTVTRSSNTTTATTHLDGAAVTIFAVGHGTLSGYLLASQSHDLNTGDRVLLRNSSSVPSLDGYREITRLSRTQFTINVDLSSGKDGISGTIRPTSIREATIKINGWPVYTVKNHPRSLRAGDMVQVTLDNAGIYGEQWLCYSISKDGVSDYTILTLFRDLDVVAEPGDQSRKMLRDLSTRVRETANAVFQPVDKTVESGLDFLPEGPSRSSSRLEYGATGSSSNIDILNPSGFEDYAQAFPDDFRLSFKQYEDFSTREKLGTDLMRIDGHGIRADGAGDAKGGGGLTLLGRSKTGETGATADFHPAANEATLYLRQGRTFNITGIAATSPAQVTTDANHGLVTGDSVVIVNTNSGADATYDGRLNGTFTITYVDADTFSIVVNNTETNGSVITNAGTVKVLTTGSGLYVADRGIWSASGAFDEWDHDTPAMQHELFTGFSGFVEPHTDGKALIHLPSLDVVPHIFLTVCSADSSATDQYIANITGWTLSDIGTTSFTGTGADDMTVTATSFASTSDTTLSYRVQIAATGTPDTFEWSNNRVSAATRDVWNTSPAATVNTSTSNVTLDNSITVKWKATTGHTVGDYWDFTAHTTSRRKYTAAEITVFNDAGAAVDCAAGDVHVMYMVVFNSSRTQDGLNPEVDGVNRSGFSINHDADSGH